MQSESSVAVVILIDDDAERIKSVASVLDDLWSAETVFLDDSLGIDHIVQRCREACHDEKKDHLVFLRMNPRGWATASLLEGLRSRPDSCRLNVVLVTEGPFFSLPVHISDSPFVRLVVPDVPAKLARVVRGLLEHPRPDRPV